MLPWVCCAKYSTTHNLQTAVMLNVMWLNMPRKKSKLEKAAGKLISSIQKEWGLQIGEPSAEQSELVMNLAHDLLQARSAAAMREVLGSISVKEYLGVSWVQSHRSTELAIQELEFAIQQEKA